MTATPQPALAQSLIVPYSVIRSGPRYPTARASESGAPGAEHADIAAATSRMGTNAEPVGREGDAPAAVAKAEKRRARTMPARVSATWLHTGRDEGPGERRGGEHEADALRAQATVTQEQGEERQQRGAGCARKGKQRPQRPEVDAPLGGARLRSLADVRSPLQIDPRSAARRHAPILPTLNARVLLLAHYILQSYRTLQTL